jgi:hypothetical protein
MLSRSARFVPHAQQPAAPDDLPAATVSRRARISARIRVSALDRALIDGADPARGPALAARAALLTSRRGRSQLAAGLEQLVRKAQGSQRRWWALEQRQAILANASELHAVAMELHSEQPLYAAGLARVNQLLVDGSGPAYCGPAAGLARALRDARAALAGAV